MTQYAATKIKQVVRLLIISPFQRTMSLQSFQTQQPELSFKIYLKGNLITLTSHVPGTFPTFFWPLADLPLATAITVWHGYHCLRSIFKSHLRCGVAFPAKFLLFNSGQERKNYLHICQKNSFLKHLQDVFLEYWLEVRNKQVIQYNWKKHSTDIENMWFPEYWWFLLSLSYRLFKFIKILTHFWNNSSLISDWDTQNQASHFQSLFLSQTAVADS